MSSNLRDYFSVLRSQSRYRGECLYIHGVFPRRCISVRFAGTLEGSGIENHRIGRDRHHRICRDRHHGRDLPAG